MATRKNKVKGCWGYHLTLDAGECDHAAIRSKATIAAFTKELVEKIDMVAYGPPRIVMFGTGGKKGYTLVQLIETSNITAHFVEEVDAVYLDVFSCKKFKTSDALAVFKKYFKPKNLIKRIFTRQAKGKKMTRKLRK
jgi:S-adenosylmethionine/arginine decarboxylase-like enzyme